MYKTLLGKSGFRKGMDLYFQRHDGQAVTCEDFFAATRDANQADFSNFFLWKTVQPMELSADELSDQRSVQLRDLFESLSVEQPARRPCATLSPEDLSEIEWFYLMRMSFSFAPFVGSACITEASAMAQLALQKHLGFSSPTIPGICTSTHGFHQKDYPQCLPMFMSGTSKTNLLIQTGIHCGKFSRKASRSSVKMKLAIEEK